MSVNMLMKNYGQLIFKLETLTKNNMIIEYRFITAHHILNVVGFFCVQHNIQIL